MRIVLLLVRLMTAITIRRNFLMSNAAEMITMEDKRK